MVLATQEQKNQLASLLRLQQTNGSFEMTPQFLKLVALDPVVVEQGRSANQFDAKGFATAIAMEFIEKKLAPLKEEWQKPYDKAKLFVFKVWADSQPAMKEAAIYLLAGGKGKKGDVAEPAPAK